MTDPVDALLSLGSDRSPGRVDLTELRFSCSECSCVFGSLVVVSPEDVSSGIGSVLSLWVFQNYCPKALIEPSWQLQEIASSQPEALSAT